MRLRNREGNGRTDGSRIEQDLDRDGLKGVDCSSFVWRGLKNAGYDVPAVPFSTHTLFNGASTTGYARQHFDVIPAADARRDHSNLRPGDILLFKDKDSGGQHVGIFSSYDANGHIRFIGSQVSTGPAEAGAAPGSYWNGRTFEIVGALRAKPEFQIRTPLHAQSDGEVGRAPPVQSPALRQPTASRPAPPAVHTGHVLQMGEKGPAVTHLQRRLFELGYRGEDGRPLGIDADFGRNTLFALKQFQREHGLEGKGIAGPKTAVALERAGRALVSSPSHPHHALYEQALQQVRVAERANGTSVGAHSERIAAALTVECIRRGIGQVDRVEINRDRSLVRAVHDLPGNRETGLGTTDMISLPRAALQPMGESSRQCHEAAVDAAARRSAAVQQHRQAAPAMTP
jgi:hypothetical protein